MKMEKEMQELNISWKLWAVWEYCPIKRYEIINWLTLLRPDTSGWDLVKSADLEEMGKFRKLMTKHRKVDPNKIKRINLYTFNTHNLTKIH